MSPILDERGGLSLSAGPSSARGWNGLAQPTTVTCNLKLQEAVSKTCEVPPCRLQGRFGLFLQKMRRTQFPLSKMCRFDQPMGTALQYEAVRAESSIISELT